MSAVWRVVATVLLAPIVVVVAGVGGCEARKAYYDREVRRMCTADGGVVIFERLKLTHAEYDRLGGSRGEIPIPEERSASSEHPYVSDTQRTTLRDSNPAVWRTESVYKRRADGRIFARVVSYSRVGGDFPSMGHASSFSCPNEANLVAEVRKLISVEEKAR
jgi:hypothetical protein